MIYSWKTKKVENGFMYKVLQYEPRNEPDKNGYYVNTTILQSETLSTRARAKGKAQRWCKYYRSQK